ncbi:hypothetical protein ILYODFUR_004152 [Ilyodon furcidens]|uniref:Bifunctional inhibitor/plant lipid transfer protein/seed storage helical domain-containing protein n=2 Tax=Goodeidae TaxID=28758 RepID=A0ABV0TRS2_9TELE
MGHRLILVALIAIGLVSSWSAVQERSSEFSCCDLIVSYLHDLSCENIWNSNEMSIAEISGDTRSCESPCKEIEHDRMILDGCVNVSVVTVCTGISVIKETRVTYLAQMCHLPLYNGMPTGIQSSVGLLLLAVMTGWRLCYIS